MPDSLIKSAVDDQLLVLIPAGKAILGSPEREGYHNERPQFEAFLPDYYLGPYCVTNVQYAAFLSAAGPGERELKRWIALESGCFVRPAGGAYEAFQGKEEHPVWLVSWFGAVAYCEWAGLRLPSELEWEKGARGVDGRNYPWGEEWDPARCLNAENRGDESTCAARDFPEGVSPYGLYNTSGNVWEWTADRYDEKVHARYAAGDLTPPDQGRDRVLRGGASNLCYPPYLRCAYRCPGYPEHRRNFGFRCCRGPVVAGLPDG
jgi:formylglycine-generating enzyme required for sulfatase activity